MLFNEEVFFHRFKKAAENGFEAVEIQFPYMFDKSLILEKLEENNLKLVLHNLPSGNNQKDKGIACNPNRKNEFQDSVGIAIEYAKYLNCKQLNCLSGIPENNNQKNITLETLISNLQFAADKLEQEKIKLQKDIFNRDISYSKVEIDNSFPEYIIQNKEKLKDWILK